MRRECLVQALKTNEYWGIWGGLDERERRAMIREHGNPAKAATFAKTMDMSS